MVRLNRIYTRTGDNGSTGLVDGSRLAKHSLRIEAIGRVDEANSAIGLAAASLAGSLADGEHGAMFQRIQNDLFDLGADLATPAHDGDFIPSELVLRVVPSQVEWLERAIDAATQELDPLTSFVLPGGCEEAARTHVARASTRAAERAMTALAEHEPVNPSALAYINRLSDYLFVLARLLNANGAEDVKWVPGASRLA